MAPGQSNGSGSSGSVNEVPLCPSCHAPVSARATHCVLCDAPLTPVTATSGATEAVTDFVTDEMAIVRPELRPLYAQLSQALAGSIRLKRLLGEGGMGLVFLGRDAALKRDVAVKVLSPALADDSVARARFTREAEAAAAVAHPNIVNVYQVGELPGSRIPYFVMQFVEGPTLADATGRVLPESRVRRLVTEIAAALAAAHRRKLVHRDVKPGNIILDGESGRALVLDFGISAALSARRRSRGVRLTTEGMYVGTPTYMSPEQASGEDVTPKSDVYSLGVLAYELLTGKPPFEGNALQVMAAQIKDRPPSLGERRPDVSQELVALVERCLEKDPARRPTAQEIVNHLSAEAKHVIEWPPPGLGRLRRAGTRLVRAASAMTLTIVAFFVTMALEPRSAAPPGQLAELLDQWRRPSLTISRLMFAPRAADVRQSSAEAVAIWSFLLAAVVALLLLFALLTVRRLGVAARLVRSARASGYPWKVLRQVASDGWTDTADLLNGMGAFAFVGADERQRLLVWRRAFVLSLAGAFILAVIAFLVWLSDLFEVLGGAATTALSVTPGEAVAIVAAPAAALIVAAVCLIPELRVRERETGGFAQRRSSGAINRELVKDWLSSVGQAAAEPGRPWLGMLASVPVALLSVVVALSAVVVIAVVGDTTLRFVSSRGRAAEWVASMNSDSLHLLPWSIIDTTFAAAGREPPRANDREVTRHFVAAFAYQSDAHSPLWIADASDSAWRLPVDHTVSVIRLRHALFLMPSTVAAETLRTIEGTHSPARLSAFRALAETSVQSYYWPYRTIARGHLPPRGVPSLDYNALRNAALLNELEGAIALARGDTSVPLMRARENIAVARQLTRTMDYVGTLAAATVGRAGADLLQTVGRLRGNAAMLAQADSVARAAEALGQFRWMSSRQPLAFFADPNDGAGLRLVGDRQFAPFQRTRFLGAIFFGYCLNAREMLFGISAARVALFDSARSRLADVPRADEELRRWQAVAQRWRATPSQAYRAMNESGVGYGVYADPDLPDLPLGGMMDRLRLCLRAT